MTKACQTTTPAAACARCAVPAVLAMALLVVSPGPAAHAQGIDLSILPATAACEPGDTVTVELTVTTAGHEFNGYDAQVRFDPERLTFLQRDPVSLQEGPLMTDACASRFHRFEADSARVTINHVLLCGGVAVTGPGVVYRLAFVCGDAGGPTELTFTDFTNFYDDGVYVDPVRLTGAVIDIDGAVGVPGPGAAAPRLDVAPNPFNPRTVFSFDLDRAGAVRLTIHDVRGRRVRTLVDAPLPAGPQRRTWDGKDAGGRAAPSGAYVARLVAGGTVRDRVLTLIR